MSFQSLCRCSVLSLLWSLLSCGGGNTQSQGNPTVPQFAHVFIVVEENHSSSQVIGQPTMPYFNSLANQFGLATNYFANTHPSLPNYFVLTTGQTLTNSDDFTGVVTDDTVVKALTAAGKTWKCYADSIPGVGYNGGNTPVYDRSHVPFLFFSTVQGNSAQTGNVVPFTQLAADMAANQLPDYAFIVPNQQNNAHDCPGGGTSCDDSVRLGAADAWLSANIQPLINHPTFQQSGLLLITFDEGSFDDTAHGGGQVPLLVISSKSKPGFKSTSFYQHQNTLRLMLDALGVTDLPGNAAGAAQMGEFFQ
jgi:phosphatidylinositol-3-phosphatase